MYDAIIIGGGIVGTSLAYHLVRAGARALLIDRNDAGRATSAGAGILTPERNERTPPARYELAVAANEYYRTLIAQLGEEQAGDTGYAVCGQLTVAISEDELAPYAATRAAELAQPRLPGAEFYTPHELDAEAARELFPALAATERALYYPHGARIDGRMITAAVQRAAVARGLELRGAGVERIVVEHGVAVGVESGGARIDAGAVAIAGGAWSLQFGEQLGLQLPIAPQRGQIVHLHMPGAASGDWPVVCGFRGHYIVAWPGGRVVAGATRETGAGFAAHTTAAGLHSVLGEALRVAPGLAAAAIADLRVGLRPASADGLPILGGVPELRNLYLATGHGANGLQLGPYSAKLVADLMLGHSDGAEMRAFGVARFIETISHTTN